MEKDRSVDIWVLLWSQLLSETGPRSYLVSVKHPGDLKGSGRGPEMRGTYLFQYGIKAPRMRSGGRDT
jgi:hypothetical protein